MPSILFLGADPGSTTRLALDREMREIAHRLRAAPRGTALEVAQEWAVQVGDLQACLLRHRPRIVHFSGQGSRAGQLLVEDGQGGAIPVHREALAALFALLVGDIQCVVLSACFSIEQARAIARHIDCVVGLPAELDSEARLVWSGAFYQALGFGETVEKAALLGSNALALHGFTGAAVPEILFREGVRGSAVRIGASGSPFFVPFSRNPGFVGREGDLVKLHALLQQGEAVGVRPAMLTGMGGIGKTQLAVEYVHAQRRAYPGGVYWVNAAADWQAEFARLAIDVGCSAGDAPESERRQRLARAFAEYLRERPEALVVFDNVEDPRALRGAEAGFVPVELGCRLLFTTRRRDASKHFSSVEVSVLPAGAARALLLSERSAGEERETEAATAMCRMLGYLPLALALAGAFLGQHPEIALGDYRDRLAEEGCLAAVDDTGLDARDLATRHTAAVGATLHVQWAALTSAAARQVLQTAALFEEAAQVPRARLSLLTGLGEKAEKGRPAPLGEALRAASQLWLVEELTEEEVRLHPLVREFVAGTIAERGAFEKACTERMGEALWDMGRLHEEVARRGVDAVLADLRAGAMLRGGPEPRIARLLRALDLEAHHLRAWEPAQEPGFFLQQLRNCCLELGWDDVQARVEVQFVKAKWPWLRERIPTSRASEALVRSLAGHTAFFVNGVAVTANSCFAVSASSDRTLKVWELATGQVIRTLAGHTSGVTGVALTAHDRFAISASLDRTLKVWELATGQVIRTLAGHTSAVTGVTVTADGRFVVSASSDRTLKVWEFSTGHTIRLLAGHTAVVTGVAVTVDGRFAVSASWDTTLQVWDLGSSEAIRPFAGHMSSVTGVAVTADGRFAVSTSWDMTIHVWDLRAGQKIRTLTGRTSELTGVAVTADGRFSVSASRVGTLQLWDLTTGQAIRTLEAHNSVVTSVAMAADGRFVVSASKDKTVQVWDLATGQKIRTLADHTTRVNSVVVTADGRFAVAGLEDGSLHTWVLATGESIRTLAGHTSRVNSVVVSADSLFSVSGSDDGSLKVWDLATGMAIRTLEGHTSAVNGVAMTADGRFAVSTASDRTLKVWDLATGKAVATRAAGAPLLSCAITPDGRTIVAGDAMGAVHFLDWVKP